MEGYGEVEEVMSEFNIVNQSSSKQGRYRAARAAKNTWTKMKQNLCGEVIDVEPGRDCWLDLN